MKTSDCGTVSVGRTRGMGNYFFELSGGKGMHASREQVAGVEDGQQFAGGVNCGDTGRVVNTRCPKPKPTPRSWRPT